MEINEIQEEMEYVYFAHAVNMQREIDVKTSKIILEKIESI